MKILTKEHRAKIALAHLGKKRAPFSLEWRAKIGAASKGNKYRLGSKDSEATRLKKSIAMRGKQNANHALTVKRILKECVKLEEQGFRAVPTGWKVIPDIIAVKDGQIYAVEVEYGRPNYRKYNAVTKRYYDDVIWIIRDPKESA